MGEAVEALRELLVAFFAAYLEDATELRKQRMSTLLVQADARGLLGPGAVQPLAVLFASLQAELQVDAQRFAAFYHFVFFVARERGHRNLSFGTAVEGWRFVLGGGRFALLPQWCDFVHRRPGTKGISEDTWCQVRVFILPAIFSPFRSLSRVQSNPSPLSSYFSSVKQRTRPHSTLFPHTPLPFFPPFARARNHNTKKK